MNYGRLVAAAVAGTIADAVYGFLVYGMLLTNMFGAFPSVYRAKDVQPAYLPLMFLAIFVAMLAASAIYAKGYEGKGPAVGEGMRFGILFGIFSGALFGGVSYATLNIGRRLAVSMAGAGVVEWILVGTAIGAVYRPALSASGSVVRSRL
jgi:hypothetical protein